MNTISIPTNDRLHLLERCLNSIQAAKGVENWTLVFSCEPNQPMIDRVKKIGWAPIYVNRNPAKMGCWVNTFLAANFAMTVGSTLNLYLEDDIVISPDTLIMVEQFATQRTGVLALRRPEATLKPAPDTVVDFRGGLFGDGFAWTPLMWNQIRAGWFCAAGGRGFCMWDWSMEHALHNVPQYRPLMNRSQNIGITGTHQAGFDPNRHSECYHGPLIPKFRFIP